MVYVYVWCVCGFVCVWVCVCVCVKNITDNVVYLDIEFKYTDYI